MKSTYQTSASLFCPCRGRGYLNKALGYDLTGSSELTVLPSLCAVGLAAFAGIAADQLHEEGEGWARGRERRGKRWAMWESRNTGERARFGWSFVLSSMEFRMELCASLYPMRLIFFVSSLSTCAPFKPISEDGMPLTTVRKIFQARARRTGRENSCQGARHPALGNLLQGRCNL